MRCETIEIKASGQVPGPAVLTSYILDEVSVTPGKKRPTVIACPGGAYMRCSDRESEPVIMQFLGMGCHAFLLNHSVAPNYFPTALQELAEAVTLLQGHSDDQLADTERIMICGSSATGHLACSLGVSWNREPVYGPTGRIVKEICLSAMLLEYPVITPGKPVHQGSITNLLGEEAIEVKRRKVSLELQVIADTPRTFLWHIYKDEAVPVGNSLLLASVLRKSGMNLEFHIFPKNGHGAFLVNKETSGVGDHAHVNIPYCQSWIKLVET